MNVISDTVIKQQLSSLVFVKNLCDTRIQRLKDGLDEADSLLPGVCSIFLFFYFFYYYYYFIICPNRGYEANRLLKTFAQMCSNSVKTNYIKLTIRSSPINEYFHTFPQAHFT